MSALRRTSVSVPALLGLGVLLAGCGSETPAATGTAALSTADLPQVGRTLVDSAGKTVYFADQEASGTIHCTGACLGFWFPVTTTGTTAPAVPGGPQLGIVKRTDNGQNQLVLEGKPLYTFRLDGAPGASTGNNLGDDFDGVHFSWHAATLGGTAPVPSAGTAAPGGGYGGY